MWGGPALERSRSQMTRVRAWAARRRVSLVSEAERENRAPASRVSCEGSCFLPSGFLPPGVVSAAAALTGAVSPGTGGQPFACRRGEPGRLGGHGQARRPPPHD